MRQRPQVQRPHGQGANPNLRLVSADQQNHRRPTLKHASQLALAALLSGLSLAASAADSHSIGPGQRFYEKTCAKCHEAGIGPVIKGRGFPPATYVIIARNGMNAMPSFRVTDIDDATLEDLANYLSKTEAPKAAEPAKK